MRFYCLRDNKDFYTDFKWGTRVFCDLGPHDLGKRFPDEPFWEHCCDCEATWVAGEQGYPSRAICPGCARKLELGYLCHICETFGLRRAEDSDQNNAIANEGPVCGSCSADLGGLRWHYCVSLGKSFASKRNECPFCDAAFFPITASDLLSSPKGQNYRLARINDLEVGHLSLVPAIAGKTDEVQFFLLGGSQGAIVVPRFSTRSMIDKWARKYQQVFDWSSDWSGEILIDRPAIFELSGKGWRLRKHGKLTGLATINKQEDAGVQPDNTRYSVAQLLKNRKWHKSEYLIEQESHRPVQAENDRSGLPDPEASPTLVDVEQSSKTPKGGPSSDGLPDGIAGNNRGSANASRTKAKLLYRSLVSGGLETNDLAYLELKKGKSEDDLSNGEVFLKTASPQGAFVLFVGSKNEGWVFPNPEVNFAPDSFRTLFPNLTANQFVNFKAHIEPVQVNRAGKGRWQVWLDEARALEAAKSAVAFPISAEDCLSEMQGSSNVVRHDVVSNLLVSGPDGKGELALIHHSGISKATQSLLAVPRITRFQSTDAFYLFYDKYYDCAKPSAGVVWIIKPAVVSKVQGGWQLKEKGVLEIDWVRKEERPAVLDVESEIDEIVREQAPEENPLPRPVPRWRSGLVIGIIASLILLTALVAGILRSPPAPVTNNNASPTPSPSFNMVPVQGGAFQMGTDAGDEYEKPAHTVNVSPFLIDANEVTCEEYQKFIKATSHRMPANWISGQYPNGAAKKPVTGVDWDDANAYARWAGKRLPTEEEWEFAARGTDSRRYPWGNDWQPGAANADNAATGLVDIGTYKGASPAKAYDMVGNAWEWTASPLAPYPGGHLPPQKAGDLMVIRGGSWQSDRTSATTTYRFGWPARGGTDYRNTGFRCAKDVAQAAKK